MKVLFAVNKQLYSKLFSGSDLDRINRCCEVIDAPLQKTPDKDYLLNYIEEADIVITSWGTACLDSDVITRGKDLKLLTHAAGSVKPVISDPLFDRRIKVTSSAAAISYGVAEFCLGMILMAPKRVFWAAGTTKQSGWAEGINVLGGPFEIYQQKIGIIGASHVGRHLIKLLKNFTCDIMLYDPYLSAADANALGAAKVDTLEELFSQCRVVSLNAPSTEQTKGMIGGEHFKLLSDGSVFINTARGAIVREQEMIAELEKQRFIACLDVTEPEPPEIDSPLRTLPNVILTPHIAGVVAENMLRLGTFTANEIEAFVNNKPLYFEVTREQLSTIG